MLLTADCLPVALARVEREAGARRPPRRLARAARRDRRGRGGGARRRLASRPRSARASARAASRSARRSPSRFGRASAPDILVGQQPRPRRGDGAGAARRRLRVGRARRPLHLLRAGAALLAPPRPGRHRAPGDRCRSPLTARRSPRTTPASARRSGPTSPWSRRRSTSRRTRWRCSPRPGSRSWGRTVCRTSRPSTSATARRFRWHFIGHLQSRKARDVSDLCELCHSLASESAARRLTVPALVEVNLSGEDTKSGVPPESLAGIPGRGARARRRRPRPDDDAAAR